MCKVDSPRGEDGFSPYLYVSATAPLVLLRKPIRNQARSTDSAWNRAVISRVSLWRRSRKAMLSPVQSTSLRLWALYRADR